MLKLEAMQLKMRGAQLSWKIADKFLNIHKRLEVLETNKDGSISFPPIP